MKTRIRKALALAAGLGVLALAAQWMQGQAAGPERTLATTVADGFTLAAVGDLIMARPRSMDPDPQFQGAMKIIRDTDVAFGNFEGTALDLRHSKAYPQAESGGGWATSPPGVARDLKVMGFDILSRANNHTTDWGVEGMRETDRLLDEAGLVHAGSGENLAAARAARYLETPKGRIAFLSMASSFTPMSRASSPVGEAPGRPGVNALRTTRYVLVTHEIFQALLKLRDAQPKGSVPPNPNLKPNELELFEVRYRESDKTGFSFEINPEDQRGILRSIRQGKQNSDFLIATIHAHDPGIWSELPPDFMPVLAHAAINAGADAFIVHGPHQLRGIEIYRGKPIFYSLGNFFFEPLLQEPQPADLYEQHRLDPTATTDPELMDLHLKERFKGHLWYESVIAVTEFARGQASIIRLYPVDLGAATRVADRGFPRLASPPVARVILERIQRESEPFGTKVEIDHGIGLIRVANQMTEIHGEPQGRTRK